MTDKQTSAEPLLSLLAPGRDRLRLALALRERESPQAFEALPEPFIKLGETVFSNLFLGKMDNSDGLFQQDVVVKIQKDRPLGVGQLPNPMPAQALKLEAHSLGLFAHKPDGPLVRSLLQTRGESVAPVFFCKRVQQYFHPLCPQCALPLRDCRDDDLLQAAGLPAYSSGQTRYLHCRHCAKDAEHSIFYSNNIERNKHPKVLDRWQLIAAYVALVKNEAAASMPCYGCQHQGTCYQSGQNNEAVRLIVPLAFHDFQLILHEWLPLKYDEFTDLLGGKPWQALLEDLRRTYQLDRLALLEKKHTQKPFSGFVSLGGHKDRLAAETIYGKLSVFTQLCRAVHMLHQGLKRPVYELNPDNIWIAPAASEQIPAYWGARLKIANLDNAVAQQQGANLSPVIGTQGESVAYLHPALQQTAAGERRLGRITVTQMRVIEGDRLQMQVLLDSGMRQREEAGFRRVLLSFGREQGFSGDFHLDAEVVQREQSRLLLRVDTQIGKDAASVREHDVGQLQAIASIPGVEISYQPLHSYNEVLDLFSLGMLLFRTLLVNAKHSLAQVSDHVGAAGKQWSAAGEGQRPALISAFAQDPIFRIDNIWYEPQQAFLPLQIWQPVIALGLDLVCASPDQSMEAIVGRCENLTQQFRQLVFNEPAGMHEDMVAVLLDVIHDPQWLKSLQLPVTTTTSAKRTAAVEPTRADTVLPPRVKDSQPARPPREQPLRDKPARDTASRSVWPGKDEDQTGPTPVVQTLPQDMTEQTIIMAGRMAVERTQDRAADDETVSTQMFSALERSIQQNQDDADTISTPQFNVNATVDQPIDLDSSLHYDQTIISKKPARPNRPPEHKAPAGTEDKLEPSPRTVDQRTRDESTRDGRRDTRDTVTSHSMDSTLIIRGDTFDNKPARRENPKPREEKYITPPSINLDKLPDFDLDQTVVLNKQGSQSGYGSLDKSGGAGRKPNASGNSSSWGEQTFDKTNNSKNNDDEDDGDIDNTIIIRPDKE